MGFRVSFRVDLCEKSGVSISLLVVRNQIVLIYTPRTSEIPAENEVYTNTAYRVREHLRYLGSRCTLDNKLNMVRGDDPEHVKRHHGSAMELNIPHTHFSFDRDVDPGILNQFMSELLKAQNIYSGLDEYQFVNINTTMTIVRSFIAFNKEFTGSSLQKQFLEERELTRSEKENLIRHASQKGAGTLMFSEKRELERCGFNAENVTQKEEGKSDAVESTSTLVNLSFHKKKKKLKSDVSGPATDIAGPEKLEGLTPTF
jgi:hypothetical protein